MKERHGLPMASGIRYLGIDPSLRSTGLCYIDDSHIETWTLAPKGEHERGMERLLWLRGRIEYVLDLVQPTMVVVEGYAFGRSNQAHHIGEWGGILRLAVWDRPMIGLAVVPPDKLKKFATGAGGGKKSGVILGLYKHWGFEVSDEDEADAAALALMGFHLGHPTQAHTLTRARAEAVEKVNVLRWPGRHRRRP